MRVVTGHFEQSPVEYLGALDEIAQETGTTIQAFDSRYVVSRRHLERAGELADRAIERGDAIADDRGVEIMLYAAGRRQIDRALEMGLKEEDHPIAVVVDGVAEDEAIEAVEALLVDTDEETTVFGDEERLRSFFDIIDTELDTGVDIEALILERVALLTIDK